MNKEIRSVPVVGTIQVNLCPICKRPPELITYIETETACANKSIYMENCSIEYDCECKACHIKASLKDWNRLALITDDADVEE